jgi:hypothetical protein
MKVFTESKLLIVLVIVGFSSTFAQLRVLPQGSIFFQGKYHCV